MHLSEPIVQWLREPGEGLLYELMQIFTDLSCLSAAVDSADRSLDHQTRQSLLDECLYLERQYSKFYSKISSTGTGEDPPIYGPGQIKTGIPVTDTLFGPAYKFSSVGQANLHILIWTSLSLVHPLIYQAYILTEAGDIPKALHIDGQSPQHTANQLSAHYISKAIRCLPYCAQENMGPWAIFYGIFSACQASRVFSHIRDWERVCWALKVIDYIALSGFDLASRMLGIYSSYWFEPERHNAYRLPYTRELTKVYHSSSRESSGRDNTTLKSDTMD